MAIRRFLAALALLLVPVWAVAQVGVTTRAAPVASTNSSGTIAVTNTFQTVWAATGTRQGCLIVNTSINRQWVYFGPDTATPTIATAVPLEPASIATAQGGSVNCSLQSGTILTDHVWITGTAGGTFVATQQ